MKVRGRLADRSELIAEVAIQGSEPFRKLHRTSPMCVETHNPVIHILHLRRFDERVRQVLARWLEGVIDLEAAARLDQRADNLDLPIEECCPPIRSPPPEYAEASLLRAGAKHAGADETTGACA